MRAGLAIAGLGAVAVLATGALVGVLVTQPFVPEPAAEAAPATQAAITTQTFTDERPVTLETTIGEPTSITVPVGGRVTALACAEGGVVDSGTSPVSLDGVPLLALATATPPWRDVASGDRGVDVTALQAELTRLGFDVSPDGDRAGRATRAAFRELAARSGLTLPRSGPLPLTTTLWLPASSVPVAQCQVRLGDIVEPGAALATSDSPLLAARVAAFPATAPAGPRVLVVDGVELPLDESGAVVGEASLAELGGTSSFARAAAEMVAGTGDGAISATMRLAEALRVAVVPPGAVGTDDGVSGCVATVDGVVPVRVVGSQLGQTYVVFEDGRAPTSVLLDAPEPTACR